MVSPPRPLTALSLIGLFASLACLYVIPDSQSGVLPFLGAMGGATLSYLALVWMIHRGAFAPGVISVILLSALFHGLLIPTGPHLDDDLYRYTWDGKVLLAGENPYLHPPNSLELIELWRKDQYRIPYDYVPTIYPPGTQAIFWVISALERDSFRAMKIGFSIVNLGVLGLILLLLKALGRSPGQALIYGLNPLVLKEVANSGHMDPWLLFWLLASLLALMRGRQLRGALALGLAVVAKWVPLILLPLYLRSLKGWAWLLAFGGVIILAYLPFIDAGPALFGGLGTYGDYWVFNPGLFSLIEGAIEGGVGAFIGALPEGSVLIPRLSRLIAAGLAGLGALWIASRVPKGDNHAPLLKAAGLTLGLLLLLAPTVDPWYLLWIAPFVALFPSLPGLAFTLLPLLSYAFYLNDADPLGLRLLEYAILFTLMARWVYHHGLPLKPIEAP